MEDMKLIATKRDLHGSSNANRLRLAGGLPGVIYGAGREPVSILLNRHDFEQVLYHHSSETVIIPVEIVGESERGVLVKEVQRHPVTGMIMHVDLQVVDADKPITVEIMLKLIGEAPGEKLGGLLDQVIHAIEVECLPGDLVEFIEVDISHLQIGDALHLVDLQIDSKFTLLSDISQIVVSVSEPRVEEDDDEEDADESTEPEMVKTKKVEEE